MVSANRSYAVKKSFQAAIIKGTGFTGPSLFMVLKGSLSSLPLHSAGNLTRTQATGAGINTLIGTVNNCSYTFNVWFPCSVGTSVRVGNLNTESYIFAANFTFCHVSAPPLKGLFFITTLVFYQIHAKIASVFPIFFHIGSAVIKKVS